MNQPNYYTIKYFNIKHLRMLIAVLAGLVSTGCPIPQIGSPLVDTSLLELNVNLNFPSRERLVYLRPAPSLPEERSLTPRAPSLTERFPILNCLQRTAAKLTVDSSGRLFDEQQRVGRITYGKLLAPDKQGIEQVVGIFSSKLQASVNLRYSPSLESGVIRIVPKGSKVVVLSVHPPFLGVQLEDGDSGWMLAKFVTTTACRISASARQAIRVCPWPLRSGGKK